MLVKLSGARRQRPPTPPVPQLPGDAEPKLSLPACPCTQCHGVQWVLSPLSPRWASLWAPSTFHRSPTWGRTSKRGPGGAGGPGEGHVHPLPLSWAVRESELLLKNRPLEKRGGGNPCLNQFSAPLVIEVGALRGCGQEHLQPQVCVSPAGGVGAQVGEASHSFPSVSKFTPINPPRTRSPRKTSLQNGVAVNQSRPRIAPRPGLCRAGEAGASACPPLGAEPP